MTQLRRERYSPRSGECLREPGEHYEVSGEGDLRQPANAERREGVLVLELGGFDETTLCLRGIGDDRA